MIAWTFDENAIDFWDKTGLWPNHAYAVLGVMKDANHDHIVLRNPHGYPTKERDGYARGSWKAIGAPGVRNNGEVQLNTDGVFAITREMFYKHFEHIGWVELRRRLSRQPTQADANNSRRLIASHLRWIFFSICARWTIAKRICPSQTISCSSLACTQKVAC